ASDVHVRELHLLCLSGPAFLASNDIVCFVFFRLPSCLRAAAFSCWTGIRFSFNRPRFSRFLLHRRFPLRVSHLHPSSPPGVRVLPVLRFLLPADALVLPLVLLVLSLVRLRGLSLVLPVPLLRCVLLVEPREGSQGRGDRRQKLRRWGRVRRRRGDAPEWTTKARLHDGSLFSPPTLRRWPSWTHLIAGASASVTSVLLLKVSCSCVSTPQVVAVRRHSAFCCLLAPSSSRRQTSQCLAPSCSSLPLSASSSASAVSSSSPFSLGASSASRPERETVPGGCGRTDDCLLFRVERGQCAAVPVVWQFDIFQQLLSFHEKHELRGEDLDGATAFFFRHFAREVCHTSWLKAEDALLRSRTHFVLSLPGASSSSSSPEASALSARGLEKDALALKSTQRPLPVLLPICAPLLLAPHFSTPHSPVSRVSWLAARGRLETAGARGCLRRWEHLFWERPRESACGRRLRGKRDREGTWRGRGESDLDAVEKEPEKGGEKEANGGGETVQRDKEEIKHQSVQVMSEDENVTRETQQIQTMEEEEETDGTCTLDPASASLEELISALSQTPETQHEAASSRLSFATPSSSLGSVLPSTSSLSPTYASASSPQSSLCTQSHSSSVTSSASSSSGMRRKRQPSLSRESLVACCEAKRCRQRGERRCRGREDGEEAKSSEIRVRRLGPPFLDFWLLQVATASEEAL
ncbi:hypothetical protein TGMAS_259840B, partial [Toxoplasma gondii MAS]